MWSLTFKTYTHIRTHSFCTILKLYPSNPWLQKLYCFLALFSKRFWVTCLEMPKKFATDETFCNRHIEIHNGDFRQMHRFKKVPTSGSQWDPPKMSSSNNLQSWSDTQRNQWEMFWLHSQWLFDGETDFEIICLFHSNTKCIKCYNVMWRDIVRSPGDGPRLYIVTENRNEDRDTGAILVAGIFKHHVWV